MAGAPPSGSGFGVGLESLLANPLLQTALAGYLGFAGSPRKRGLGAALSQGGLYGLETFNQAEQLKQRIPLEQAQTQKAQAAIPAEQARAQLYRGQAAQAQTRADAQKQALDWLDNDPAAQKMDPQQRMLLRFGVATGKIDPAILGLTPYQKGQLDIKGKELSIAQKKAEDEEALIPARERYLQSGTSEREASMRKAEAEAGAVPSLIGLRGAEAERALRPAAAAKPKQVSALDLEKQAAAEAEKSWAAAGVKERWFGNHDAYVDAFRKHWMAKHGGGTAAALPPDKLPATSLAPAGGASPKDTIAADLGL